MENLLIRVDKIDGFKDKMIKQLTKDKRKQINVNSEVVNLNENSNYIVIDVIWNNFDIILVYVKTLFIYIVDANEM